MEKIIFGILLSLTALPSVCLADWKGTLEVQGVSDVEHQKGSIFAKGSKLRFELQAKGQEMVILADAKSSSASMLMPAQKMVMEMPASMADKKMLACSTDDVDGCIKAKGYKKTGSDSIDGHPCAVYEGDETHGGKKMHQKLWRPTDMKEVFMVKSVTSTEGHEVTTFVKNIQQGKLEDALFKVPSGYKKMQLPSFGAMHH